MAAAGGGDFRSRTESMKGEVAANHYHIHGVGLAT